jgi:mRNA-degrading endonuclease toxin of MazEF toxin-antitoxin module
MRSIDKTRLRGRVATLSHADLKSVEEALLITLDLPS